MQAGSDPQKDFRQISSSESEFAFLDKDDFRAHYVDPEHPNRFFFYLENVHCTSCLRRIESVAEEIEDLVRIRLDMSKQLAEVEIRSGGRLSAAAERLKAMGYAPRPVAVSELRANTSGANRSLLVRIGVTGACAGNIMLFSTSLYAGAGSEAVGTMFEWLSLVLFLPVLFYGAVPFYRTSWAAIRNKRSSIDVPIAAAVIVGSALGIFHLVRGEGDIYFDSLAVLVFLLLSSRYLLAQLQSRFLSPNRLRAFYETGRVRVLTESGQVEERHIDDIVVGDTVVVRSGERIPVDGVLLSDEAYVNASVLTGEVYPQRRLHKESVYAGTVLTSPTANVLVEKTGDETRIGRLLGETERGVMNRTPLVSITDRVAQWFSVSVLTLGLIFAIAYSFVDIGEAINRALALVILACPCALALATPLTQSLALRKAAKRGCLIKKADALEKLVQARTVFLDKTGTLTRGELRVERWWPSPPTERERGIIAELQQDSHHPVARLLSDYVLREGAVEPAGLTERCEIAGVGVSGKSGDDTFEFRAVREPLETMGAPSDFMGDALTVVGLYRNGKLLKAVALADRVRESSDDVVGRFTRRGVDVFLLTGDGKRPAETVGERVGIRRDRILAEQSPEEKAAIVGSHERALMVGDGVNDSVALANAHVSVAVHGSMEASFRAADVYLTEPGLVPLADLLDLSHATISIIKRNLVFSLLYNATFGTLALLGFVNPLVAAVLMPVSSATVVLSSVIGNGVWRRFASHYTSGGTRARRVEPMLAR